MSYPNRQGKTGDQIAAELTPTGTIDLIITGTTPEAIEKLTTTAEAIGKRLAREVTASQIRNIFGTVRTIEQDVKSLADDEPLPTSVQRSLLMLRPKLAYQYGRIQGRDDDTRKAAMGALVNILSQAIGMVGTSVVHFRNFMDFFEAILAYHRRHGGSNS
jgi:CRISPR-associated protein Csm2